jgi:hypothetical protein
MNKFNQVFKDEIKKLDTSILNFPWEDRKSYMWWLSQTTFFVSHSSTLLALASSRFGKKKYQLHQRFLEHAAEESGHESLSEKDITNLGGKIEAFSELNSTSNFYQTQYYLIDYVDPIAFLGYIFMLEGIAVHSGPKIHDRIKPIYGPGAVTFLKVHSSEDPEHLEKAFSIIDDLNQADQELVIKSFHKSCHDYREILSEINSLLNKESIPLVA